MLTQLLKDKRKSTDKTSSKKSKGKWKEEESLLFVHFEEKGHVIAGVEVVLVSPQNYVIPRVFSLTEPCSNNVAEYNAFLIGMQIANEIGVKNLEA